MEFATTQQCDTVNSIYDVSNVPSEFTESNLVNFSGEECGSWLLGGFSTWSGFSQTDSYENQTNAVNALTIDKKDGANIVYCKRRCEHWQFLEW